MPAARFTDDELTLFLDWFERTPSWSRWQRRTGDHGEDVIELSVDGRRPRSLRIARCDSYGYMVTGFDGWALTVCDSFDEVMAILSRFRPARGADAGIRDRETVPLAG
ncbi:MAG: hypothetical protein EA406_12050 [Rhodospirillales bacterium]|nr:MAG: hypothetical protein EA406_12050 [Rhodospirillales bacterium]